MADGTATARAPACLYVLPEEVCVQGPHTKGTKGKRISLPDKQVHSHSA